MAKAAGIEAVKEALEKLVEKAKEAKELDFEFRDSLQEFAVFAQEKANELSAAIASKLE